jgi:hypothetical protein
LHHDADRRQASDRALERQQKAEQTLLGGMMPYCLSDAACVNRR